MLIPFVDYNVFNYPAWFLQLVLHERPCRPTDRLKSLQLQILLQLSLHSSNKEHSCTSNSNPPAATPTSPLTPTTPPAISPAAQAPQVAPQTQQQPPPKKSLSLTVS